MPKFLDNIEFYTEGYSEKTLTINKETVDIDLEKKSWNEEWNKWNDEGKVELEIPSEKIKYPSEDPAKKKITDVSRDIEEKKDEAIYKIGALSGAGLNATNELVQMGLNIIGEKTDEASSLINNGKEEIKSSTNQGLNVLEERIEAGLGQINDLNLHNGQGSGSLQQVSVKYTGPDIYDGENVSLRNEDIIPGTIATGYQSAAFGGLRYDCAGYNYIKINEKYYDVIKLNPVTLQYKRDGEEGYIAPIQENDGKIFVEDISWGVSVNDKIVTLTNTQNGISIESSPYGGRTPTSAEGNQSFAAGASCHAHGDFSVALNQDTVAYQQASMAIGGRTQAGMTEDDYFELYTLTPDKFPVPTIELDSTNHYQKYMPVNQSVSDYTSTYCALYKYENGKLYYTHVNYANNSVFPGIYTPEECLRSNYTEVRDVQGSSYDSSHSYAFAGGAVSKAYERNTFAFGSSTIAKGRNAVAFNSNTIASGLSSFATGIGPDETYIATNGEVGARGRVSFVEGKVTDATGEAAHAGGALTKASGDYSFAFGYSTRATEDYAMSIGASTVASGKKSFAGGGATTASGENAFVFGDNAVVNGISSAAFGSSNNIYLNSNYSFVAGLSNNIQYGSQNIILGNANSIGNPSSTKGCSNNFVANSGNTVDNTSFNANNTAVFGFKNIAKHSGVFINGNKNKSSSAYQTVIGKYNEDNSAALLIVGSGDDRYRLKSDSTKLISLDTYNALGETDKANYEENRKNALEVVGNGIKTNSLQAISNTDSIIYFNNNLNGNRVSSIWANDISILLDGVDGSYTSVGNKFKKIEETLETKLNLDALDSDFFNSIY